MITDKTYKYFAVLNFWHSSELAVISKGAATKASLDEKLSYAVHTANCGDPTHCLCELC